jgi:SAM-dependent methyltransferase
MTTTHHEPDLGAEGAAIQEWKRQIAAYRHQRGEVEGEQWGRLAPWHDEWVAHNDYVTLVLPRLGPCLGPKARVLEIGPGSGGFTVPLARIAAQVVAVEPSPGMRGLLASKLAQAGLSNVEILTQRIEESLDRLSVLAPFTLTLASFSLYNVENIHHLVQELLGMSRHLVILLGTGTAPDWSETLYEQLKGEKRQAPPQLSHLYPVLMEMGIPADVEIIWGSDNYVYRSEEALVSWWMRHYQMEEARREELRSSLLPLATRNDETVGLYHRRPMALVWIDRERHVLASDGR